MRLEGCAAAMEKSTKPEELSVASFIRRHAVALRGFLSRAGRGLARDEREELECVALLAVVEAVRHLAGLVEEGQAGAMEAA